MSDSANRIKPRGDFRALIVYPNLPLMLVPGLAIAIFTRILKEQGYRVDMFDTTHYDTHETNYSEMKINYSENRIKLLNVRKFSIEKDLGIRVKTDMLSDFRQKVIDFAPDVMLFSVVEDTFLQSLSMLDAVRDLEIPHLVGGVFPTMAPEVAIAGENVNLIGIGEGERTIVAVSEAVREGHTLEGIPGTWFRRDDGEIVKAPPAELAELNDVTPDFSLFDESRFNRPMGGRVFKMLSVESYRGCPFACTYCNSPAQRRIAKATGVGNFMRRSHMSRLRDYFKALVDEYDPEFLFFSDDSFLARPRAEIFEFCDMYEEFRLPFYFNTRSESCEPDIMRRLKDVNCYRIAFGIESGNEQFRNKVLRRKITNAEILKRFEIIAESGIAFSLNVIIGMPGETRDLVMDTIELVRSIHGYDTLTSFIFTPYHGTPLREVAVANGWLDPYTITRHNTSRSLLRMPPPYLSADEIDGLLMTLPLYCYFPKSEWDSIRRAETPDEEGLKIRQHYSDIYSRDFLTETQDAQKTYPDGDDRLRGAELPDDFRANVRRLHGPDLERLINPMAHL